MTFEMAENDETEYMRNTIDKILDVLGHPEALVTDESRISDFEVPEQLGGSPIDLVALSQALGVEVKKTDYLVDVARKMRGLA